MPMQYGAHIPQIISDPSKAHQSEKKVMDGIIHSAMLTGFQRKAIDGLVESGMPSHKRPAGKDGIETRRVKPSKTQTQVGAVHYGGSKFSK